MAAKNFIWNNGSATAPIVLTNAQLDKLIAIGRTDNNDITKNVSGHITTNTGNIRRYYYEILGSLFPNLNIHGNIIEDVISVNISKNIFGENDNADIIISGIQADYLNFDMEHAISGISGDINENIIKSRITIENNQLKVAAPQENASWSDTVNIYVYPIYEQKPETPTFTVYVNAVKITAIDVDFPTTMLALKTVDVPIVYTPANNTKSDYVTKNETVSAGTLDSSTRTYTSPDSTTTVNYVGTFIICGEALTPILITKSCTISQFRTSTIYIDQRTTVNGVAKTIIEITGDIGSADGATAENNVIAWIRANSHLFVCKYNTTTNKLDVAQLYDGNKLYYDNNGLRGNAAPTSTLGNDVFLKLPEFYYKCVPAKDENNVNIEDVWALTFADRQPDDLSGWKKWDDKWFIGAYEGYVSNSKLYSTYQSAQSTGSQNIGTFNNYANARNTEYGIGVDNSYSIISYSSHKIMALLYYAYYGNVDSQSQCGTGSNSYQRTMGATNTFGMNDTTPTSSNVAGSINFWGLENWWGDKNEWMTGVTTRDTAGNLTIVDGNLGQTSIILTSVTSTNNPVCIKRLYFDANADVIPIGDRAEDSNYASYYYDGSRVFAAAGCVANRSASSADSNGGVGYLDVFYAASVAYASLGSRLEYHGDYNIVSELN